MPRILVVDDDVSMRSVIKDHLSANYEVLDTGTPETALAMTLEHKPDAILLDLAMPGLSGFELCRVLSSLSITQQIPVFIITGEDERNKAFCQNLGALRYFTKPLDFTKLKTDLSWVLESRKTDRRVDPRMALRLVLTLKWYTTDGVAVESRAETENISKGGFLCAAAAALPEGLTADVFWHRDREYNLGSARLLRIDKRDSSKPRYAFQFIVNQPANEPLQ